MNWTDEDLDFALRDLRDAELAPGALEAVRARVMERTAKPRLRWWAWSWLPALAAALVMIAVIPRGQPVVEPPPLLAAAPPAPLLEVNPPAASRRKPAAIPGRREPVRLEKETQFVKLITDDPDVVIYWALNSNEDVKGEQR
ncbi:MAG: hypothetical protein HZB13_10280 [Acidobacteria bacterium]|nr:hypothetical protein [Acidobacteriota bacterium]